MSQTEHVLITFEGRDTGLATTARTASESIRRVINDVERLKGRAPALANWKRAFTITSNDLSSMRHLKQVYDNMVAAGQVLGTQDQRAYDNLKKNIPLQTKRLSNIQKIVALRNEENMRWNEEIQKAKTLQSIEARISQNRDMDISRAKTMEEITRRQQQALVTSSADKFLDDKKGIGAFFSNLFGGMGGGGRIGDAASAAGLGQVASLASKATIVLAALTIAVKALVLAFKMLLGAINLVAKGFVLLGKGLLQYTQLLTKLITVQGSIIASIGRFVKGLWEKYRAMRQSSRETEKADGITRRYGANMRGLVGTVTNLNRSINMFGASIRQIGQAVQNAGVLLTIYLSIPVGNVLKQWTTTALDFDHALIEVRKTTGLAGDDLDAFRTSLMQMSTTTPTDITGLANIAADAARIGVATENLVEFTHIMDMLVTATTVSAGESTTQMGRLLNIFYGTGAAAEYLEQNFSKVVNGIGSALNELGQANAVTENEILAATMRMAPAAQALEMPITAAMALAATVASGSASAERAGTQVNAALSQVAVKIEEIARAGGMSMEGLAQMVRDDPIESFIMLAESIAKIEDPIKRQQASAELFGLVGAKAVNIAGASYELLKENVELANTAFEEGTSLIEEFERAQDSVSSQLGILKNNFKVLGITIGEAVLPEITKIVQLLVPVVQAMTQGFKGLSVQTKQYLVLGALLIAILGPLSYALGSILFQIGIFTTGMTGLIGIFSKAIIGPLRLMHILFGLLTPMRAIIIAVTAVIAAIATLGSSLGSIGVVLHNVISSIMSGIYSLMAGFADNIYRIITQIYDSIYMLLTGAAKLIQFDPAKDLFAGSKAASDAEVLTEAIGAAVEAGEEAGEGFGEAFVEAVSNTDLTPVFEFAKNFGAEMREALKGLTASGVSQFSEIYGFVSGIFSSFTGLFDIDDKVVTAELQKIAKKIVGVIKGIEGGASGFAGIFDDLRSHIGDFAGDLERLLDLTNDYVKAEEALARIKERLEGFDRKTEESILAISKRTDLSAFQRAGLIRQMKVDRKNEKRVLEDQEKEQQKKVSSIREEIDAQKELINILKSLIPSASSEKKGKAGDENAAVMSFESQNEALVEAQEKLEEVIGGIYEKVDSFADGIRKRRQWLVGIISGLLDERLLEGVESLDDIETEYFDGYGIGKTIRDNIIPWWDMLAKKIDWVQGKLDLLASFFDAFSAGVSTGFDVLNPVMPEGVDNIRQLEGATKGIFSAGALIGAAAKFFDDVFLEMQNVFLGDDGSFVAKVRRVFNEILGVLIEGFNPSGTTIAEMFANVEFMGMFDGVRELGPVIESILTGLADIAGLSFDNIPNLVEGINGIVDKVLSGGTTVLSALDLLIQLARFAGGSGSIIEITRAATGFGGEEFGATFAGMNQEGSLSDNIRSINFASIGVVLSTKINELLATFVDGVDTTLISTSAGQLINLILGAIGGINPELVGQALAKFPNMVIDALGEINPEEVKKAFTALINTYLSFAEEIKFEEGIDSIFAIANALVQAIGEVNWTKMTGPINEIATSILENIAEFDFATLVSLTSQIVNSILDAIANNETAWNDVQISFTKFVNAISEELAKIDYSILDSAVFDPMTETIRFILVNIHWDVILQDVFGEFGRVVWRLLRDAVLKYMGLGFMVPERDEQGNPIIDPSGKTISSGKTGGILGTGIPIPSASGGIIGMATGWAANQVSGFLGNRDQKRQESFASGDATKDAYKQGEIAAGSDGFSGGYSDELKKGESFEGLRDGWNKFMGSSYQELEGYGTVVGEFVGVGVGTKLSLAEYMSSLGSGMVNWIASNVLNLELVGKHVGKYVNDGIYTSLASAAGFAGVIAAVYTWVGANGWEIFGIFYLLGKEAMENFKLGFSGGSESAFAAQASLSGGNVLGGIGSLGISNAYRAIGNTPIVSAMDYGQVSGIGGQDGRGANSININVDGYISNGEVDVLADLVWNKLERRIS